MKKEIKIGLAKIPLTKSGAVPKKEFMQAWQNLEPRQKIRPRAVPKGHTGTTIAQDGIRITGSPKFIEQVLSQLKDLIDFDGQPGSRLAASCSEITDMKTGERIDGKYRVAIHVHSR